MSQKSKQVPARLCSECQDPIPAKRLLAVPHAQRCTPCQSLVDQPRHVPEHVLVVPSEGDDQTRVREMGWPTGVNVRLGLELEPVE